MDTYIQKKQIPDNIKHIRLDVGLSYGAPFSKMWLDRDKDLFIFGFEPNPFCLEILHAGNIQSQHPNHPDSMTDEYLKNSINIIPVALANVIDPTTMKFFSMANDCGTSSLYEPVDPSIGPVKKVVDVPVYSLKHFFDAFDWNRFEYIEYIKIDAQGSDFDIILSAGDYLKERVVYITAEPEMWQYRNCSHNSTENMRNYLESQNFIQIQHPNCQDPTFINKKFMHLKDEIYVIQTF